MEKSLNEPIRFLKNQQKKNGCFVGKAGSRIKNFEETREHPTVFFSALILWCLRDVAEAGSIKKKLAVYLMQQRSRHWSWNYWQRRRSINKKFPYPDDMDDTARSLLALFSYKPELIGADALAGFIKLLISVEEKPSGPYRTWLVSPDLYENWGDTDIAVNASIGSFLAVHKVSLAGLNEFIAHAISNKKLGSPYYVGDIPTIYFLSDWYIGNGREVLKRTVTTRLQKPDTQNALMLSLLITSGKKLGVEYRLLQKAARHLRRLENKGHWPAEALYLDPQMDGVKYFAGSEALSTAFAIEALSLLKTAQGSQAAVKTVLSHERTINNALAESHRMLLPIRSDYRAAVRAIAGRDSDGQITNIANLTAQTYNKKPAEGFMRHLNLGSLNGWIAYSIYDDFLDDEGIKTQLGVANTALRLSQEHFYRALPRNKVFQIMVVNAFAKVDAANSWEVSNARAKLAGKKVQYRLPDYKDYQQLAYRSWGHVLAPSGVLFKLGYGFDSRQLRNLHVFFKNFLIARQLNDDAHDWQTDLEKGHLSAVVVKLLRAYKGENSTINLKTDTPELRLLFWQSIIGDISAEILRHARLARNALARCGMQNEAIFTNWIDAIENATKQAVNSSEKTKDFIKAYRNID